MPKRTLHVPSAALALAIALSSCAHQPQPTKATALPDLSPPVADTTEPDKNPGSLFNDAQSDLLFADNRARRVGDIVLINIVENSSSDFKANTTSDKTSSHTIGMTNFFNHGNVGVMPFGSAVGLSGPVGSNPLVGSSITSKLDTTGETKRSATLVATIATRVTRVLPGGVMQVEGARETRVNNENQIMVVRGLIRQRDIAADNSVASTSVADAKIEYYGEGSLGDKQKAGWLSRMLDNVWPF